MPRVSIRISISPAAAAALERLAREIADAEGRDPERCRSMAIERLLAAHAEKVKKSQKRA